MNVVRLRLDKQSRSVCSGRETITVRFFFIETRSPNTVRIWFQHGIFMITIDLSANELPDLVTRVEFGDQPWKEGTGPAKEILHRARLDEKAKCMVDADKATSYKFAASSQVE